MTLRDLTILSLENLRLKKFRAFLTMSGIVIAIAAFISMVSFGAGIQENIQREYERLGLFTTIQVYPKGPARSGDRPMSRNERRSEREGKVENPDTVKYPPLDHKALERLAAIPGVNLAYPFDPFDVTVRLGDSTVHTKAMSLPSAAAKTKMFVGITNGKSFTGDSEKVAIISRAIARGLGVRNADSLIGTRIVVSVRVSMLDSGLVHIVSDKGETIFGRLKKLKIDSLLRSSDYRRRTLSQEADAAVQRFMHGLTDARLELSDTLTVCGIRDDADQGRIRIQPLVIPIATAQRFTGKGFSTDPMSLIQTLQNGSLFRSNETQDPKTFSQVTLDLDPKVLNKTVRDSVEKLGFRPFSFAEQFEEIQKSFFYLDMALGVVGLIALFTASLGIINTMVMSVSERRREIGILKSLGADDGDIWQLFLVESGVIGLMGTVAGILAGWGITRIVAAVAAHYMKENDVPVIDPFSLPIWLIAIALTLGIGIALLAGLYPAARAARVDPVMALRNE